MEDFKSGDNTILVIDDEKSVLDSLVRLLKGAHYRCLTAMNAEEGVRLYNKERPLVVLTDLLMNNQEQGITVLEEVRRIDPDAVVILYTAFGNVPNVVEAFKKGAFDYIQKVQTHVDVLQPIQRGMNYARMQRENLYLRNRLDLHDDTVFYKAVGVSKVMRDLFERAKRVALNNAAVMIVGETGTGKEVIAQGLHYHSRRNQGSFVPVAVGALPENLLEAELFGHVKGAFTGANIDKEGLFEFADKGSLFLDEISELNYDLQHKLLRVLQDHKIRRLGTLKEREVDVRIISATNQDPEFLVEQKKLRQDLFYRLQVIRLNIPPLRERREDIPVLVHHFMRKYRHSGIVEVEKISSDALLLLQQYDWPGNVRQLEHSVEEMIALAQKAEIGVEDLPDSIRPKTKQVFFNTPDELDFKESKARIIEEFEKHYLLNLLNKHKNITKVAEAAGLNRKTIYRLMEARGILRERNHADEETPEES